MTNTNDRFLLVPGLSGCKLLLNDQDVGWPGALSAEAWIAGEDVFARACAMLHISGEDLVQLLSMEFADPASDDPTKTTLKDGGSVTAGPILELAYTQFSDYVRFTFDWRSDIRSSGAALLSFLREGRPTNGKWRILAHSLGGQLICVASKLCGLSGAPDEQAFSQLVSRVAFLGCPFSGTVKASDAFISGTELSPQFSGYMQRIVRTWPSLYQLLPAWPGCVEIQGPNQAVPASYSMLDDQAWAGQNLNPAFLLRARETHRIYFDAPFRWMSGIEVRLLMSLAHPTWSYVLRTGPTMAAAGQERGDTLVPYNTTLRELGDLGKKATHGIGGDQDTAVHSFLANDPVFATEIRDFLSE